MPRLARLAGLFLAGIAFTAPVALADTVADRLQAALAANEAGDLRLAGDEMAAAAKAMAEKKAALLNALLPPAPEGWTQTVNAEYTATLAMAGGGTGTEARYDGPDGQYVTIGFLMDSPLMAMMMGMFGNPQMLSMMGKTVEVNGTPFLDQDNSLVTVIDQRIMVTLNGAETAVLLPLAQLIDYTALAAYDSPK